MQKDYMKCKSCGKLFPGCAVPPGRHPALSSYYMMEEAMSSEKEIALELAGRVAHSSCRTCGLGISTKRDR
jgi:hypothetical protein